MSTNLLTVIAQNRDLLIGRATRYLFGVHKNAAEDAVQQLCVQLAARPVREVDEPLAFLTHALHRVCMRLASHAAGAAPLDQPHTHRYDDTDAMRAEEVARLAKALAAVADTLRSNDRVLAAELIAGRIERASSGRRARMKRLRDRFAARLAEHLSRRRDAEPGAYDRDRAVVVWRAVCEFVNAYPHLCPWATAA